MSTRIHVCQGGSAEEAVRKIVGDDEIIGSMDDLAIGPLHDIDTGEPQARVTFWKDLWQFSGAPEIQVDFHTELLRVREQFAKLSRATGEVVIWSGENATEQTLRHRALWWLADADAVVSEVRVSHADLGANAVGPAAIAMVAQTGLTDKFSARVPLATEQRAARAAAWLELRTAAQGVRVWSAEGLSEAADDYVDRQLLALVGTTPVPLFRCVGEAMAVVNRSDLFCTWRYAQLLRLARIKLISGSLSEGRDALICRVLG